MAKSLSSHLFVPSMELKTLITSKPKRNKRGGGGGGGRSGGGGDSGNEGEDEVEWVCSVNWFEPSSSSTCRCRNVRWKFLRLLVGEWIDYVVDQCRTVVPTVELPAPRVIH